MASRKYQSARGQRGDRRGEVGHARRLAFHASEQDRGCDGELDAARHPLRAAVLRTKGSQPAKPEREGERDIKPKLSAWAPQ
jgi:hypothetical protein